MDKDGRDEEGKRQLSEFDGLLAERKRKHEADLAELKTRAEKAEAEYQNVVRGQAQRVSKVQKDADMSIKRIGVALDETRENAAKEVEELTILKDSMKEEIRAMQERFGVRV